MLKFILFILFISCSSVPDKSEFKHPVLRPEIQTKIDLIRELITKNQFKQALAKLSLLNDAELSELEKAVKFNLKGVVFFNEGQYEKSLANFDIAKKYIPSDSSLRSQIFLNIGSVYYKQSAYPELKNAIDQVVPEALNESEIKKFSQLKWSWAYKYEKHLTLVESGIVILNDTKTFQEIQKSSIHDQFMKSFKNLSDGEKIRLFDRYKKLSPTSVIFLAQHEADKRYFENDKSGSKDLVNWLDSEYGVHPLVVDYVKEFRQRMDFSSRLSMKGIGVVLPLTGDKSIFGQRTLFGIESAIKDINSQSNLELYTKDNLGSNSVGAQAVREVIFEKRVPLIIGGLFPELAKAEYLEARKFGVLFISLSPVQLPREQKNYLLIEVTGSIESQIESMTQEEQLKKFGKKVGLIYPEGEMGESFLNEFWRKAELGIIELTAVTNFQKQSKEYLDPVQKFLGLKFPRERKEEMDIWQNVYSKEKSSIRRIQFLPPVIDFDWVFLAALPHESQSLIPTFAYFDAKNLTLIGGPTWGNSKDLLRDQKMWGRPVYFVGEDPLDIPQQFFKNFFTHHGKQPGVVEVNAYDGMKAALQLLEENSIDDREEFDQLVQTKKVLNGLNKNWELKDGLWLKKLDFLTINKGEIKKVNQALE
jgi:ABC-type branched-subunit amino acid transport system substrate-binding protein